MALAFSSLRPHWKDPLRHRLPRWSHFEPVPSLFDSYNGLIKIEALPSLMLRNLLASHL
jgi:hypothetical protein